jgi:hypothetical protein
MNGEYSSLNTPNPYEITDSELINALNHYEITDSQLINDLIDYETNGQLIINALNQYEITDSQLINELIDYETNGQLIINALNQYEKTDVNLVNGNNENEKSSSLVQNDNLVGKSSNKGKSINNSTNQNEDKQITDGEKTYVLKGEKVTLNKKFNIKRKVLNFEVQNKKVKSFFDAEDHVKEFVNDIFTNYIEPENKTSYIRMVLQHELFETPISTCLIKQTQFNPEIMIHLLANAVQSKKQQGRTTRVDSNDMSVSLTIAETVHGSGKRPRNDKITSENFKKRSKPEIISFDDYVNNANRTITVINNYDNYCLVRAILIGKARIDKDKNWYRLLSNTNNLNRIVNNYVTTFKIPDLSQGLNLNYVRQIEKTLEEYNIVIYSQDFSDGPVYWNQELRTNKYIYILYYQNHFNLILSMKSYLKSTYFCDHCQHPYQNIGKHICDSACKSCLRYNCEELDEPFSKCGCGINSRSEYCKERHEELVCYRKRICDICNTVQKKIHVCLDQKYCYNCKAVVEIDHMCYMLTVKQSEALKKRNPSNPNFKGFVFFDFEAYEDEDGYHTVNLAMSQRVCVECLDADERCEECTPKIIHYNINEWVRWMLKDINKHYTFIAHNSKGYDSHFIINELHRLKIPRDNNLQIILNGTKIMSMFFRNRIIKDSSLFISMKLEKFSKAFGIETLKKGWFPHQFNRPENFDYNGPYPEKSFYGYNMMTSQQQEDFDKFYDTAIKSNSVFDFKKELEEYCWSDVALLTEGCIRYSRECRETSKLNEKDTGICPFIETTTLASYCNLLFRRNFLEENTIGIVPAYGFNPKSNMSKRCEIWLKYLPESENITCKKRG